MSSREELVKNYFRMGLNYNELVSVLATEHNERMSVRHLKRLLRRYGLHRRKTYTNLQTAIDFITYELQHSGRQNGYRWMHLKCIQNGLTLRRETVRMILSELDPTGVQLRTRHRFIRRRYTANGPNFVWHMDGYDKLKPYGIAIHGSIDGFSRKIIWLRASFTNNDPRVIGGYYIRAVTGLDGCPARIRADHGTENGHVEVFQKLIRHNADACFLYGKSQLNQRIESWWGMLRKECGQFWMDLFELLKDDGLYCGDWLDINLMQVCFMKIIQVQKMPMIYCISQLLQLFVNRIIAKTIKK